MTPVTRAEFAALATLVQSHSDLFVRLRADLEKARKINLPLIWSASAFGAGAAQMFIQFIQSGHL